MCDQATKISCAPPQRGVAIKMLRERQRRAMTAVKLCTDSHGFARICTDLHGLIPHAFSRHAEQ